MRSFLIKHHDNLVWVGWLLYFAIAESLAIASKRDGDTLSERTRDWFKVGRKGGRDLFIGAWVGFAAWFLWHIVS